MMIDRQLYTTTDIFAMNENKLTEICHLVLQVTHLSA